MTRGADGLLGIRSGVPGIAWPPVQRGTAAALAALLHQLDATQWLPQAEVEQPQLAQLRVLAEHAAKYAPHVAMRLRAAGLSPSELGSMAGLRALPVLTRRDVQKAGDDLFCTGLPPHHGPVGVTRTSGSTGEPVVVRRTAVTHLVWMAMTLRDHLWHRRDARKKMSAIRANVSRHETSDNWGAPFNLLFESGLFQRLPITLSIEEQVAHLKAFEPDSLIVYPSNLAALARTFLAAGERLEGLAHIRTIGETLSDDVRSLTRDAFGLAVEDLYSSQEIGSVALQCPESGLYHIMAESLIVELLNQRGAPCAAGEVGRIVITDLHNFATPLVRYDIGDYAEAAGPCPCGRGLPALKRIIGRERNLVLMPDGTRHWPLVGFALFRDIAPIAQYQMIQDGRESVEVRLVAEAPLSAAQEARLTRVIQDALGHPFALRFSYFEGSIPAGPNGKFEEFVCRVA
ncbi:MAG: phenylacetate--CoA ligase family protein [Alphaproteobacteria bacterium]